MCNESLAVRYPCKQKKNITKLTSKIFLRFYNRTAKHLSRGGVMVGDDKAAGTGYLPAAWIRSGRTKKIKARCHLVNRYILSKKIYAE